MDAIEAIIAIVFGLLIALIVGLVSYQSGVLSIKEQAIAANVAEYVVDAKGSSTFVWKTQGKL